MTPDEPLAGNNFAGNNVVVASWAGTTIFAATSALAVAVHQTDIVGLLVAVAMFLAGIGGFFVALVQAADRSRTEEIGILNLFFLDHSAPQSIRRSLLASLAIEIVTAIVAAAIRPNTSVAFGILAPIYGLSLAGVWGARHGTFPPRAPKQPRQQKRKPQQK